MLKALAFPNFPLCRCRPLTFNDTTKVIFTLSPFYDYSGVCIPPIFLCLGQDWSLRRHSGSCATAKHLISRKFVLAQTATITIWELSQNGTKILRRFLQLDYFSAMKMMNCRKREKMWLCIEHLRVGIYS